MSNGRTTINVSKEAHRKAKDAKDDDETWSRYLLRSTDVDSVAQDDRGELIEDIRDQLKRLDDNYEKPETDPVDYAELESRMERVIERMLR